MLVLLSSTSFGEVRTQGVELGTTVLVAPRVTLEANYTYFAFDVRDGGPLAPNAPRHAGSLAVTYATDRVDLSATIRHVNRFERRAIGLDVANALNDAHFETLGGNLLGRRALASIRYAW